VKLLVITDDPVELAAGENGTFDFNIVGTPEDALSMLSGDHYEAVIMDANSMTTAPVTDAYRSTQSPACQLILVVPPNSEIPIDALNEGIDGYISQPVTEESVRALWQVRDHVESEILRHRTELRHRDEEIATLVAISNIVTSNLEFVPLLAAIASETSRALDAERTSIFLYHKERDELEAAFAEGLGPYAIKMPATQGIAGRVATSRKMLNVSEAYGSPYFNAETDKRTGYETKSVLCVPLISPFGTLIGVAECLNKNSGIFTAPDEQVLTMLSPLFAVAIENALLYQDLMTQVHQNDEMTAEKIRSERLAIIGRMASSVTRDIAGPMEEIVQHASRLGQEDLTPKEKETVCQAIEGVVDQLVDRAQELLDFSKGSLELLKDVTTVEQVFEGMRILPGAASGGTRTTLSDGINRNRSVTLDLEKLLRSIMRIMGALRELDASAFSLALDARDDELLIEVSPLDEATLTAFMDMLDEPFSGNAEDHDTGLRILIAQQVIHAHGGILEKLPHGLQVRIPVTPT
jgi:GAF domain-containing protein